MTKVMKSNIELFPPSDRELTLRAQIKIGWSTISGHGISRGGLTPSEIQQIKEVLDKAQALEYTEQVRIGLQMLKHKKMVDMCRGNGTTTCRICNRDFSKQQTSRPEPIQFCYDCQMAVCSRCKTSYKCLSGSDILLCNVCYGERELWKRSGSWLKNSHPSTSIMIPLEDLEVIQHQNEQNLKHCQRSHTAGRKRDSSPEDFVNPYQLEAEDSDEYDDDIPSLSGSQTRLNFTPSPDMKNAFQASPNFLTEIAQLKSSPASPDLKHSESFPPSSSPAAALSDIGRQRSQESPSISGLSRRSAMSGTNRERLQNSRDRVRSHSGSRGGSPSVCRTISPSFMEAAKAKLEIEVEESKVVPGTHPVDDSNKATEDHRGSIPEIKIRKPSKTNMETSLSALPNDSGKSSDNKSRPSPKRGHHLVRQVNHESSDSDNPVPDVSQEPDRVAGVKSSVPPTAMEPVVNEPTSSSTKPPSSAPTTTAKFSPSPDHKVLHKERRPIPLPRKNFQEEQQQKKAVTERAALEDEFKKVNTYQSPPQGDEFNKVEVVPFMQDKSKKVGSSPSTMGKEITTDKSNLSTDIKEGKKVNTGVHESPTKTSQATTNNEFKKVNTGIHESPTITSQATANNEFKKVNSGVHESPTITSQATANNEFKKVNSGVHESLTKTSQATANNEFKKVNTGIHESPTKTSQATANNEFKKVNTGVHESPTKTSQATANNEFKKSSISPARESKMAESTRVDPYKSIIEAPSTDTASETKISRSPVRPGKPEISARKRMLPGVPQEDKRLDVNEKGGSSVSSVISGNNVSNEGHHSMSGDLSFLVSTESHDNSPEQKVEDHHQHHHQPEVTAPDQPQHSIVRRNATRVSRNKRPPPPKPRRIYQQEDQPPLQEDDTEFGGDSSPRFRSRSGVIKRPVNRNQRGSQGVSGSDNDHGPNPIPEEKTAHSTLDISTGEDVQEFPSRRSRVSSATSKDRALARTARPRGLHNDPPKWNADGED